MSFLKADKYGKTKLKLNKCDITTCKCQEDLTSNKSQDGRLFFLCPYHQTIMNKLDAKMISKER